MLQQVCKTVFGYKRFDSVTNVLMETGMPSFNTLLHISHVIFSRCWNTCSLDNQIVGHLAGLNCIWCLQLLVVLFCTCEFYLLFVWFMCFMCVWCVYYVFYVYMGQVLEIKLMMINIHFFERSSASNLQSDARVLHFTRYSGDIFQMRFKIT